MRKHTISHEARTVSMEPTTITAVTTNRPRYWSFRRNRIGASESRSYFGPVQKWHRARAKPKSMGTGSRCARRSGAAHRL